MAPNTLRNTDDSESRETSEDDPLSKSRQQLIGGKRSARVVFSSRKPLGYAVKIDGEFLRRSGQSYTSSSGWKDLPKYVQREGKSVLDARMEELDASTIAEDR